MRAICHATSRKGVQCKQPAIPGGAVCRYHGGGAPQVKAAAMERLRAMQPKALDTIDRLMDREEFPTVQLAASKAVIDWTEGRAQDKQDVTVHVSLAQLLKVSIGENP